MGEVYRARDLRLERTVAIKILPKDVSDDPVRKQRFEREAKTISSLNHPHICVLYDVGHQDGIDYLVMECVEGESLAKRLEKGPLPVDQVLKYGGQIASALDIAHRRGVIHRDLKPGNIMLTSTGAKLLDFGLAKPAPLPASGATLSAVGMRSSPVTEEGSIVGTFQYMSPEQVEGKEVDARSDLFSVGAVLYEMLTGKRAFEGKSQFSVASAILEREPTAISSIKPLTPPALDHAVRRCLAKDPDDRWQNSRDLAGELKWIAEGSSQSAFPVSRAPRGKLREILLGSLAATFALAALLLGYGYLRRPPTQSPLLATSLLPPENTAFDTGYALSPDGTRLVFSARSVEGKLSLWLRHLDSLVAQELSNTDGAILPFWSPDSQWIAFFAGGKLRKIPAVGGDVQSICDAPIGRGGSWNSRGVIVFAPSISGPLFRVSVNGGTPVQVTQLDSSTGEIMHRHPNFLPDGEHFLYVARQTSDSKPHDVYVGSLNSAMRTKVLQETSDAKYVAPGYLLFVSKSTLYAQRFDLQTLRVTGESTPLASNVAPISAVRWSGVDVSPAGVLVYRSNGGAPDTELVTMEPSGQVVTTLATEGDVANLRFSPDGRKLAVSQTSISGEVTSVWLYDLAHDLQSRLPLEPGVRSNFVWAPDGSQLALTSSSTGNFNIYLKSINGSTEEKPLHPSEDDERPQSWSPDGKYLVFDRRPTSRQGMSEIQIYPFDGDHKTYSLLNAAYANSDGQVSPDGHWIAFVTSQTSRSEVYISNFPKPTGKWQISSTGGQTPRWRRDGKVLFYATQDGMLMAVEVTPGKGDLAVGASKPISQKPVALRGWNAIYDVSPDGQRFAAARVKKGSLHAPLTLLSNWTHALRP